MRSVSFVLMYPTTAEVEACFAGAGFERPSGPAEQWKYPRDLQAAFFVSCSPYNWDRFPEEHADILLFTGGRVPSVEVHADASGRAPGDTEIRFLADLLLSRFEGFAFDDFLSLAHGWTLEEIHGNAVVDGLRFFDYVGAFKRSE